MNVFFRPACVALFIFALNLFAFAQTESRVYEFTNGNWYDGKGFKKRTFYSVNGILTGKKPKQIDETVDLKNQFVIPPLADAHTHNLDGTFNLEKTINAYLEEGTFYAQVLANYAEGANEAKPFLNKPSSLDAVYANGALTSTLGHPFLAYEPRAAGFWNPADWEKNMDKIKVSRIGENKVYWFFDSKADVDAKWEKYLAQKPDVVKIMLLDAENYEKLRANGKAGDKGLSPEVAEYVVEKAKKAGLRVFAHVETAYDFRLGVRLGIDGFAHSPYYGWNGKPETKPQDDLTAADLKSAGRRKMIITPTASLGKIEASNYAPDGTSELQPDRFERIVARQRKLFNQMRESGMRVAIGSDFYGKTTGIELWYLHDNKIFDNRTLLKIAVEETAQTIFPNRRIGKLQEGFEANFITVAENPLVNFETLKKINLRFKQGRFINLTTTAN